MNKYTNEQIEKWTNRKVDNQTSRQVRQIIKIQKEKNRNTVKINTFKWENEPNLNEWVSEKVTDKQGHRGPLPPKKE